MSTLAWAVGLLALTDAAWFGGFRLLGHVDFNGTTVHEFVSIPAPSGDGSFLSSHRVVPTWDRDIYLINYGVPRSGKIPSQMAPAWLQCRAAMAQRAPLNERNNSQMGGYYVAIGWPMRLFWVGREFDSNAKVVRMVPRPAVIGPLGASGFSVIAHVFPTGIIWWGQAWCALSWLGLVVAVRFGPRGARSAQSAWRVRRGRCAACNYDLRGNASGVCPECGASVPVGA